MFAWTDYPLTESQKADRIFRRVQVLDYDGDKYCRVRFWNKVFRVKAGYLHKSPGGPVLCASELPRKRGA